METPALSRCPLTRARRTPARPPCADLGFTLVELTVVVAIAAVLAVVGVPSWLAFSQKLQVTGVSDAFVASLHLARSEAIKRHDRVALCKSADGVSCTATGGWDQGWIIFHDRNNNGRREDAEQILRRQQALPAALRLSGNLTVAEYVSFVPTGATKLVGGGFQAGTLTVCWESGQTSHARQIILNAAGRPRVRAFTASACND